MYYQLITRSGINIKIFVLILQKMPAINKREAEKVPEEPQPEEVVESTLKTFLSTEMEIKEGEFKNSWRFFFVLSLKRKIFLSDYYYYIFLCCCCLRFAATEAEVVTENAGKNFETQMENLGKEIAEEMGIPTWGLVAILIGKKKKNGWDFCYFLFSFYVSCW